MGKCELRNGIVLENYGKPYIVAEVNSSHGGNLDIAKQMIDEAKMAGCDCVKFQSWSAETLYSRTYYDANPIAKRIVKKFSLGEKDLLEVAKYCKEKQIDFSSTPYSNAEVDFLVEECNVPYIKIASMDINNLAYVEYIAKKKVPIVMSTGMADLDEIESAVEIIESTGNPNLCLLHCISIYPSEVSTVRLNNIIGLRERFPNYPIGFSDHSLGMELSAAAVALGSALIEKHFTLDKSKMGMDNNMAIEPEEMQKLVQGCRNVCRAMGTKQRIVSKEELAQRKKMRRSIVASKKIAAGETLTVEKLNVKRPGDGMAPKELENIIGKIAVCDIEEDTMIKNEYLQ